MGFLDRSEVDVRESCGVKIVRGFARVRMTRAKNSCTSCVLCLQQKRVWLLLFKRMGNQQLHSVHRSRIMPLLRKGFGIVFVCKTARFPAHMRFEQDQNWRFIFFLS